ncbi:MAG: 50S ribosomal protein L5 [Candidatus Kerfeldbacteria bacterium]|nr:50S ribosomal protein L5 [Candidatus Kerfeldbacteria bacterium]
MTARLLERYRQQVVPELQRHLGLSNRLAVPTVKKIVVNVGFGRHVQDQKMQDTVVNTLARISGQKSLLTAAKKSISSFKLRQGMVIGAKVTLRGVRMWEFLDKFINVTLPRVRDFRGIDPQAFGRSSTLTVGLREHTAFPEIGSDEVEHLHGLEISIVTTARDRSSAERLLAALGFPFVHRQAPVGTDR